MGRPRKVRTADEIDPRDSSSRSAETREAQGRDSDERELLTDDMESALYVPRSEWPDGKTYRWVRIESNGAADNKNWSQMTRVGWSPVPRARHEKRFPMVPMPGQGDISEGSIIYGGLILCERDTRLVKRDREKQQAETRAQNDSIQTYVEQGTSQFPRFNQSGAVEYQRAQAAFKE